MSYFSGITSHSRTNTKLPSLIIWLVSYLCVWQTEPSIFFHIDFHISSISYSCEKRYMPKGGATDMLGYSRKDSNRDGWGHGNSRGELKKFSRGVQLNVEFPWVLVVSFWRLCLDRISKGCHKFCRISRSESFISPEFLRVKWQIIPVRKPMSKHRFELPPFSH